METIKDGLFFLAIVVGSIALVGSPFLIMAAIEYASWLFIVSPALLALYGVYALLTDTETGVKLVNRCKIALWKRTKLARKYGNFCTDVEVFIDAGCIGEIPSAAWEQHKSARNWGPMPKTGAHYHNPNRLPTCGQL